MSFQNKIYSRFATIDPKDSNNITIDFDGLIKRLLLFDDYIIDSIRLQDIPQLVNNFGVNGLIELLKSGTIKIHCDALTTAQAGQATVLKSREEKGALPLCSYDFVTLNIADKEKYLSDNLQATHRYVSNTKNAIKLKQTILSALIDTPKNLMVDAFTDMKKSFLERSSLVKFAVHRIIVKQYKTPININDIEIKIIQIGGTEFKAESNLATLLNINVQEVHKIIERALLDISGLSQRLSYMKNYDAISWFHEDDVPMLNEELSIVAKECNSETQEERLVRILDLKGLPKFNNETNINVSGFLKLKNSNECKEFREWLKNIDTKSNKEIIDAINSFSEKISSFLKGDVATLTKIIISAGVGLTILNPIVGAATGVGISVLDEFLLNKVLKSNGPISFINNKLPRLYDK